MNEITVQPQLDVMTLGKMLSQSGYFQDAKEAAQAAVKVLAGQELGFGPIASMTGIFIVKGKVTLSANLVGAAIKRAAHYDYQVKRLDNTGCELAFYEQGKILGTSLFEEKDAKQAGLSGQDNWKKYPRNMYFARAMSNGAKWYCPDVFGGPIYTPDELGMIIDGETGEIINGEAEVVVRTPPPSAPSATNGNQPEPRPFAPQRLAHQVDIKVKRSELVGPISANQLALVAGKLNEVWAGDAEADNNRRSVLKYLFAVDSAKDLTRAQAAVVLDWLIEGQDETGDYPLKAMAEQEARLIVRQYVEDAGQLTMGIEDGE